METVADWSDVGARLREARLAAALTQVELADRVGLDRSAVAKVEAGDRRMDALELRRFSGALDLPLAHLLTRPPAAMVSRRAALAEQPGGSAGARFRLDTALMQHARDVGWLVHSGHLRPGSRPALGGGAGEPGESRELARQVRRHLGVGDEPLGALAEVCERLALYVLVIDVDAEGASLQDEGFGVAVLGGRAEPARRRATAAHELGYQLLGDAYSSDVGVSASQDERERVIDSFAAELLLPAAVVERAARGHSGAHLRTALVEVAGTWRASWSLVVTTAARVLDLPRAEQFRLLSPDPVRADFLAVLGAEPEPDLPTGATGPAWRRAVLAALRAGDITPGRAVELLHGLVTEADLPEPSTVASW